METRSSIPAGPVESVTEEVTESQSVSAQETNHPSVQTNGEQNGWKLVGNPGSSRTRQVTGHSTIVLKPNAENKFGVLELNELEGFEEEKFTPLAMDSSRKKHKSTYTAKRGQKARTAHQTLTMNDTQNIRHPHAILKTTSPVRGQYMMSSPDITSKTGRIKLRDQIALLQADRNSPTSNENKLLHSTTEAQFIAGLETMVRARKRTIQVNSKFKLDPILSVLVVGNNNHLRWARRMA